MTTPHVVALPNDLTLPPVRLAFVLGPDLTGLDLTTVTACRARVERPDHTVLEWAMVKELAAPAPTSSALTVYRLVTGADLADSGARPLPGTWTARFFVSAPSVGEIALAAQLFVVERML